jgi:hypothetical protein
VYQPYLITSGGRARPCVPRSSAWIVKDLALRGGIVWQTDDSKTSDAEPIPVKNRSSAKSPRQNHVSVPLASAKVAPPAKGESVEPHGGPKRYLSVKQVVQQLNNAVSDKLIYKLVAEGKLRANKATGKVLIEVDSLNELMGESRPAVRPPQQPPPPRRPRGRPRGRMPRPKEKRIELW